MNKSQLEHIIRASSEIVNDYEFVIVGSQSVLGHNIPTCGAINRSMEADMFPFNNYDERGYLECIGELSEFHQNYGYYVDPVDKEVIFLPCNYLNRVQKIQNENTNGKIAYCISPLDLSVAKSMALRDKDKEVLYFFLKNNIVKKDDLIEEVKKLKSDNYKNYPIEVFEEKQKKAIYFIDNA